MRTKWKFAFGWIERETDEIMLDRQSEKKSKLIWCIWHFNWRLQQAWPKVKKKGVVIKSLALALYQNINYFLIITLQNHKKFFVVLLKKLWFQCIMKSKFFFQFGRYEIVTNGYRNGRYHDLKWLTNEQNVSSFFLWLQFVVIIHYFEDKERYESTNIKTAITVIEGWKIGTLSSSSFATVLHNGKDQELSDLYSTIVYSSNEYFKYSLVQK